MIPSEFVVTGGKPRLTKEAANLAQLRTDAGPTRSQLPLSQVPSYNLELDVTIRDGNVNGTTKITLKGVPLFLNDAFKIITKPENLNKEGLFRKEGNKQRVNENLFNIFTTVDEIPDKHIHDVCTMVKKFFRDLKIPLLYNRELEAKLCELSKKPSEQVTRREFSSLFEVRTVDGERLVPLEETHLGTLGFLMRQLNRLVGAASQHKMDEQALALVFAPNLFCDPFSVETPTPNDGKAKKKKSKATQERQRRHSQEDLLNACADARDNNDVRVAAVRLLIEKSNWIGVSPECYIAGPPHSRRSSSAILTPNSRMPLGQDLANLQKKESLKRNEPAESFKYGEGVGGKLERVPTTKVKKSEPERSSSRARDLFGQLKKVVRAKSPSRQKRSQRRETLGSIPSSSPLASSSSKMTPSAVTMLDICQPFESTSPSTSSRMMTPPSNAEPVSARASRSQHRRATPGNATHGSLRTSQVLDLESPTLSNNNPAVSKSSNSDAAVTRYSSTRAARDNPVSMLGEEYFNSDLKPTRRARRHTTPVKNNALRRNQPNVTRVGLGVTRRRLTHGVGDGDREKENRCMNGSNVGKRDSLSLEKDVEDEEFDESHSAESMMEKMGKESRMRRAKRSKCVVREPEAMDSSPSTTTVTSAAAISTPSISRVAASEQPTMVSVALSPIVITSNDKTATPLRSLGSAIVGQSQVVGSYPMVDNNDVMATPSLKEDCHHQMEVCPSPRPSPQTLRNQLKEAVASLQLPDSPQGPTTIVLSCSDSQSEEAAPISRTPPPVPQSLPPSETLERQPRADRPRLPTSGTPPRPIGVPSHSSLTRRSSPTSFARPSLTAQHSLDSQLAQTSQFRAPSSRLPTLNRNASAVTRTKPPLHPKPTKMVSHSSLMPPPSAPFRAPSLSSFRVPAPPVDRVSVKNDDPFADSDANKAFILADDGSAHDNETEDDMSLRSTRTRNPLEPRPSVALLRNKNNGMVKNRVNMFSQMNTMETINGSGRSSSLSARSSLGAISNGSNEDSEPSKPSAPPVTHGIQMGSSRPSPARSFSLLPGNSPSY